MGESIPYAPREAGRIEAIFPGGRVIFHNIEELINTIDSSTMQVAAGTRDKELIALIDSVLGLTISNFTFNELQEFKEEIASGTLEFEDRKYITALCRRLLHDKTGDIKL